MSLTPTLTLLKQDDNNNLIANPLAIKTLQLIEKSFGRLSLNIGKRAGIFGPAKLDFLARAVSGNGFEIYHASDKDILKGICISTEPIRIQNKDGTTKYSILIDTIDLDAYEALHQAIKDYEFEMEELTSNNKMPMDWNFFSSFEQSLYRDCIFFFRDSISDLVLLNEIERKFAFAIRESKNAGSLSYYSEMNVREIVKLNENIIEAKWNQEMAHKYMNALTIFDTSDEFLKEVNQVRAQARSEVLQCNNFAQLWQNFLVKIKIDQVLSQLNEREEHRNELNTKQEKELKEKINIGFEEIKRLESKRLLERIESQNDAENNTINLVTPRVVQSARNYSPNQQNVGVFRSGGGSHGFAVHVGPRGGLYYFSNNKQQRINGDRLRQVEFY